MHRGQRIDQLDSQLSDHKESPTLEEDAIQLSDDQSETITVFFFHLTQ